MKSKEIPSNSIIKSHQIQSNRIIKSHQTQPSNPIKLNQTQSNPPTGGRNPELVLGGRNPLHLRCNDC
jgi:hypothetical protein